MRMVLIRTMTGNGKEGRERRDFGRVRRMWQLKTVWGQGIQKRVKVSSPDNRIWL